MDAHVVIGANYGDEGKGLMTDYLCRRHNAELVVRFNGGAQAGHTVCDGNMRHVFSHFGSGTFAGADTYLSEHFVVNPILFRSEYERCPVKPRVFIDHNCRITLPWDMLINQEIERQRTERHGSCGVGFNETIERNGYGQYGTTVSFLTLLGGTHGGKRFADIVMEYVPARCFELGLSKEAAARCMQPHHLEEFMQAWQFMHAHAAFVLPGFLKGKRMVFEGAQGLMLDQDNAKDFPHLTRSNTGAHNVGLLAKELGITGLHLVYVSRTYLTRHGAGPLPNEWKPEEVPATIHDETNVPHPFQGTLRFAPLDAEAMGKRIAADVDLLPMPLIASVEGALTCVDQLQGPPGLYPKYFSTGPSAKSVTEVSQPHTARKRA